MAQIPIYHQQVEPPKPPSLRQQVSPEAAQAAAMGQFGGQLQQAGTAFAGKLFDLAAKNEINDSLITAQEKWQDFRRELQQDPEYTGYSEKFQSFYTGLRDTIWGKLRMPKAKTDLENRFEALRVDWQDQIQQYSDDRALNHSFTVMVRGINQDIVDKDQASVNQRISEAVATGVVAEKDGEHLRQMSLVQIHANLIGFPDSVLWLSTEDPTVRYGISREERLSLLGQYKTEWGLLRDQETKALNVTIEQTELDFMDRLQQGDPPIWAEISNSVLPLERKEHYRNLINRISEQARKAEEVRLETDRAELARLQKEVEEKKRSAAYLKAYSEIIDWPVNQEERVEDRILADPLLSNKEKEGLIDEYRKRNKEAQDAAKQKSPLEVTDDSTLAELIRRFYDFETYSNDAVERYIKEKHGSGLSNSDTTTWLNRVKQRETYRSKTIVVDMVTQYFDGVLQYETSHDKILKARGEEAIIRVNIDRAISSGKYTEQGLYEYTLNQIVEHRKNNVSRALRDLAVPRPEEKVLPASEIYLQEMKERFTKWKGSPPVKTDVIFGKTAFSDGQNWYVYEYRSWQKWDGEKWETVK